MKPPRTNLENSSSLALVAGPVSLNSRSWGEYWRSYTFKIILGAGPLGFCCSCSRSTWRTMDIVEGSMISTILTRTSPTRSISQGVDFLVPGRWILRVKVAPLMYGLRIVISVRDYGNEGICTLSAAPPCVRPTTSRFLQSDETAKKGQSRGLLTWGVNILEIQSLLNLKSYIIQDCNWPYVRRERNYESDEIIISVTLKWWRRI
jgi:hypothetical protein